MRVRAAEATGGVRFDCKTDSGHYAGAAAFSCNGWSFAPTDALTGVIESTSEELGTWAFHPNRCSGGGHSVELWDSRDSRVSLVARDEGTDGRILSGGKRARLVATFVDAVGGAPVTFETSQCRVLDFATHQSGRVRVNSSEWNNFYSGDLRVDCPTPSGGRLVGSVHFSDC
jgi:hypothetical protein